MMQSSHLSFNAKTGFSSLSPSVKHVGKTLVVENSSDEPIYIGKDTHIGELMACYPMDMKYASEETLKIHSFHYIRIVFFEVSLMLILRNWKNEP